MTDAQPNTHEHSGQDHPPKSYALLYDILKGEAQRSSEYYKWVATGLGAYASLVIAIVGLSADSLLKLSVVGKSSILLGLVSLGLGVQRAAVAAYLSIGRILQYELAALRVTHPDTNLSPPDFRKLNEFLHVDGC